MKRQRHETTTLAKIYNKLAQIGLTEQWIYIHQETNILGIHDLFGTELAMIFSFHVGLTDSVMQFFFSVSVYLFDIFLSPHCQIYYFNIRKKLNDLLSV
jgi:hypothetical protein